MDFPKKRGHPDILTVLIGQIFKNDYICTSGKAITIKGLVLFNHYY